jgi:beta-galactosidase/beta-glucuronidase
MNRIFATFLLTAFTVGFALSVGATSIPRPEYPRAQFVREDWVNLNGEWSYVFDFGQSGREVGRELFKSKGFGGKIIVPFCPESKLSGIGYTDFIPAMWYHRKLTVPARWAGKRIMLNFGAVDWESEVYIDGVSVGVHFGGTSSFSWDLTHFVKPGTTHDLVVRVKDPTRGGGAGQPRGKQSSQFKSQGCYYTRVTGIWQTVWMEALESGALLSVRVTPDFDGSRFVFVPRFNALKRGHRFKAIIKDGEKCVASLDAIATDGVPLAVEVPNAKSWEPGSPFLYDIEYVVTAADGRVLDRVTSYAGMRKIHIEGNRVFLNNKPLYFRLVLDQGYYPDGIWTAPSDAALKKDIELSMAAGFNGARLHQKVFEERFHYWADKLGYLTWGESSSLGVSLCTVNGARHFLGEWRELLERDVNHPSIVAWTPLNETGYFDNDGHEFKRLHRDVYDLAKAIDPMRPVNDASGYIHVKTDLWTRHHYGRADKLKAELDQGPGKVWVDKWYEKKECAYDGQPYINDEFGGLKWIPESRRADAAAAWGYGADIKTIEDFYRTLEAEVKAMDAIPGFSGWCYTQLTDVEQEQNGIYNYDRTTKFDMNRIRAIFLNQN